MEKKKKLRCEEVKMGKGGEYTFNAILTTILGTESVVVIVKVNYFHI